MKRLILFISLVVLFSTSQAQRFPYSNTAHISSGGSYTTQYQAVLDEMTTDPSTTNRGYQDAMVESLVDDGYWARMDYLSVYATEINSASEALINWITPGTNDGTNVSSTSWTTQEGFTGDGTADYINTNFNLSTEGSNYTQNDASVGVYLRINEQHAGYAFGARAISSTEAHFVARNASNNCTGEFNGGSFGPTNFDNTSAGLWIVTRRASNDTEWYRDGIANVNWVDADASVGVPNADMYVLNRSGSAGYSTNQVAIFFIMDGCSDAEALAINTIFETYMDAIGTGVQ